MLVGELAPFWNKIHSEVENAALKSEKRNKRLIRNQNYHLNEQLACNTYANTSASTINTNEYRETANEWPHLIPHDQVTLRGFFQEIIPKSAQISARTEEQVH